MDVNFPTRLGSYIGTEKTLKLGDVVSYPEFFNTFPNAKDIDVAFVNKGKNNVPIQLSEDTKLLEINTAYYDTRRKDASVSSGAGKIDITRGLAHELQHFVQVESENGGGTSERRETKKRKERIKRLLQDARNTKNIEELQLLEDEAKEFGFDGERKDLLSYLSDLGERESRLAETDYTKNPYKVYNQDAKRLGIDEVNFEAVAKELRETRPQQLEKSPIQKLRKKLDEWDKELDRFGKETLGMNLPVAVCCV